MCNLSAEWVLEARRRDRETQVRIPAEAPDDRVASSDGRLPSGSRRRVAMFVRLPVDLVSSLIAVLLIVMIGRFG